MKPTIPRREFLQTAGGAALAAAGMELPAKAELEESPTPPPPMPRLLTGCCAYSYRKYLASGRMSLEDFIVEGVAMGVNGVDMTAYWLK
jgi:hypothetical protein